MSDYATASTYCNDKNMFTLDECKRKRTFVTSIQDQNKEHQCGYETPCSFTGDSSSGYSIQNPVKKSNCDECCSCSKGMVSGLRLKFDYTWDADRIGYPVFNDTQGNGNCNMCQNQAMYWNGIYKGGVGI